jgi:hypothetical protein
MNIPRKLLRIWLTVSSLVGFVLGWIFLSQTVEAATPTRVGNTSVNMPDIQAIPTLSTDSVNSNSLRSFAFRPVQPSFLPRLRTGGS